MRSSELVTPAAKGPRGAMKAAATGVTPAAVAATGVTPAAVGVAGEEGMEAVAAATGETILSRLPLDDRGFPMEGAAVLLLALPAAHFQSLILTFLNQQSLPWS